MPATDPSSARQRRLALLALLLLAPAPTIGVLAAMILAPGPVGHGVFIACKLWLVLFPIVWYLKVEGGAVSWSRPRHGGVGVGALLGLATGIVILVAFAVVGTDRIDPTLLRGAVSRMELNSQEMYIAGAAYWIFINSVLEEYVYRWFFFRQCEKLMPGPLAVAASAAIFTVHHVVALSVYLPPVLTIIASAGIFIGGATWSWLYLRYRSIWPGWVSHAIADVVVFAIGGYLIFGN